MQSVLTDAWALISAFLTNDAWMISSAMRGPGVWLLGLVLTLGGGAAVLAVYRLVPLLDRHFERTVMVWSYLLIAGIIAVEVFRRFVLNVQAPWSTTLPPFLFLVMTWFGCAYNVRLRTHLAFSELRTNLPPFGQILCLCLDAALWLGFCWIVVVTSTKVAANSAANFQILLGTDDVLQWWFLATVPLAFVLMAARVLENLIEDLAKYRAGARVIEPAVIAAD